MCVTEHSEKIDEGTGARFLVHGMPLSEKNAPKRVSKAYRQAEARTAGWRFSNYFGWLAMPSGFIIESFFFMPLPSFIMSAHMVSFFIMASSFFMPSFLAIAM